MDELFTIPEVLSPRLQWKAKHAVKTSYHDSGGEYPLWHAWIGAHPTEGKNTGAGESEDECLADLARKQNIRMWNEEDL